MLHDRVSETSVEKQIQDWKDAIENPRDAFCGHTVIGPGEVAYIEKTRELAQLERFQRVATDIHVLGLGKAESRQATQIGSFIFS